MAAALAVAITAIMDFTGYITFSALPLLGLTLIFWGIQRQSKTEIGLVWGTRKDYGWALGYPVLVLGTTALIAVLYGDFAPEGLTSDSFVLNLLVGILIGPLMVLLTEEGFFRGWLWGAFERAGLTPKNTLYATTACFVIWHISAVVSGTEYGLPLAQVPVYLVNATFIGLIWGLLRLASGSVIVPAVCHAIWNALAYGLFGFGEEIGALGVTNTFVLGPEVGYLGIILNGLFFFWLWRKYAARHLV